MNIVPKTPTPMFDERSANEPSSVAFSRAAEEAPTGALPCGRAEESMRFVAALPAKLTRPKRRARRLASQRAIVAIFLAEVNGAIAARDEDCLLVAHRELIRAEFRLTRMEGAHG